MKNFQTHTGHRIVNIHTAGNRSGFIKIFGLRIIYRKPYHCHCSFVLCAKNKNQKQKKNRKKI